MALGNTPRKETSFFVEASKSYAFGMYFKDAAGNPVDLTDVDVRLVAAEAPHAGGTEILSKTAVSTAPITGFTQFSLQAEDLALEPGSYPYDVTLYPASGYSTPIIKGYIEVGSNTDLDTTNVYADLDVGSEITVVLEQGDVIEITIEQVDGLYLVVAQQIRDFAEAMQTQVDNAAGSAAAAAGSADLAASYANSMQVWLDNAGYPFWKGTQAEYDAIAHKAEVLYLITDEVH